MLPSAVPSAATRAAAPPPPGAGSLEARTVTNSRQDFVVISIRIFSFEFVRGLNRPLMGAPAAYCARGPGGDCSSAPGAPLQMQSVHTVLTPACPYRRHRPQGAGNPKNSGGDSAGVYGNLIIRQRRAIDREHSARDFSSRRDSGSAGILCVFQAFRTDGSAENIRRRPRMRLRGVAAIRTGRKSCRSRPRRCARQRGPSAGRAWS